ncbi:hypothetical protein [Spelaeicoccus albus]|uniref:Uncharacterized protein n=1 Tax=Spelaeicoccus albus TaxID=1280376 RepID=A0A7Z0D1U9_9MICO|nr:hypothetical protein [Spelaeicoccus albus]NYI66895.1 hypothetical protein [Spelaeicoccus albus]
MLDGYSDAVAHVAAWSYGDALDRSLRLTVNFHPDFRGPQIVALGAEISSGRPTT